MAQYQAIQKIRPDCSEVDEAAFLAVTVILSEIVANFTVAANQADRDRLPEIAQRIRNDVKVLKRLKSGDAIILA